MQDVLFLSFEVKSAQPQQEAKGVWNKQTLFCQDDERLITLSQGKVGPVHLGSASPDGFTLRSKLY